MPPSAQALPGVPQAPASLEDRRKALNDLFHDYWEDQLKHDPEFASSLGDKRYNDQISRLLACKAVTTSWRGREAS